MRRRYVVGLASVVALVAGLLAPSAAAQGMLAVTFLAWGHGDAAVYEGPCGERGLLDAGAGSADEVLAALDAAGGRSVAWAAVSHYDADHVGDVAEVATAPGVSVGVVYDRGGDRTVKDTDTYREYHDWLAAPGAPARTALDIGDRWALCAGTAEEVTFTVVSAGSDGSAAGEVAVSEENDRGVCVLVEHGGFDLASCGDVDAEVEAAAAPVVGDVEVAKVSHHGSATSSAQAWVDTLSAEVAVFTVGDNGFGHPDPAVVQRWDADGEVFQTGGADGGLVDGNVTITTDGVTSASVTGAASGRGTAVSIDGTGGAPGEPSPAPGSAPVFDGDPATTERVSAADPAGAALAISRARFGDGAARRVVLSRDDDFADSLAGSVLTDTGPLLYTGTDTLPAATAAEISRVLPDGGTVNLLGGDTAISAGVESGLAADGYDVRRLAGGSRVETAVAVGDEVRTVRGATPRVAVARGYGPADNPTVAWADSVTGGGWAADSASPVLVTGTDAVHPAVIDALARWAPEQTVLLGGTTALPSGFEQQVPNPARVAGADRAGTAAAIAAQLWEPTAPRRHVVVDGYRTDGWAYALAAAGLAADNGAPLLLSSGGTVPGDTLAAASTPCGQGPTVDVVVVGDTTVVPDSVVAALDGVDGAPCPAEEPPPPPPSEPPRPPPPAPEPEPEPAPNCDPAYPDFCLPPPPPDLDCGSAAIGGRKDFTALPPDPHGLDGDGNGVACQS